MDRVDRRGDPLLRQRHPHADRRHARERLQGRHRQGDPQLHRDARRQDQGPRRSPPRTSARASSACCRCSSASRMFQGQTKEQLNNPEMTAAVDNFVRPGPGGVAQHQHDRRRPDRRPHRAGGAGPRRRRARRPPRSSASRPRSRRLNLPGKLADCKSTDARRDRAVHRRGRLGRRLGQAGPQQPHQAVLPLRGKILNSEGLATGQGADQPGADRPRHRHRHRGRRQVQLSTACATARSSCSWTPTPTATTSRRCCSTFFFRHMPELIRKGHVYIAQPPLYRIDVGKETHWARDDDHKEEILAGLRANAKLGGHALQGPGRDGREGARRDDARPRATGRC